MCGMTRPPCWYKDQRITLGENLIVWVGKKPVGVLALSKFTFTSVQSSWSILSSSYKSTTVNSGRWMTSCGVPGHRRREKS
ncbi:hypothetical protein OUZ56_009338 [Daphnia magna]|uniref:Uncharacterized protein n=1 Tax=Daphnia magna TaxID=35525 RepID=A0ABR0AFQ3_9CRUS|nr:hypothetical protein OUZ56_009338 [Daphnia magna]